MSVTALTGTDLTPGSSFLCPAAAAGEKVAVFTIGRGVVAPSGVWGRKAVAPAPNGDLWVCLFIATSTGSALHFNLPNTTNMKWAIIAVATGKAGFDGNSAPSDGYGVEAVDNSSYPTGGTDLLLSAYGVRGDQDVTVDESQTVLATVTLSNTRTEYPDTLTVGYEDLDESGATGTRTATFPDAAEWAAVQVAFA